MSKQVIQGETNTYSCQGLVMCLFGHTKGYSITELRCNLVTDNPPVRANDKNIDIALLPHRGSTPTSHLVLAAK